MFTNFETMKKTFTDKGIPIILGEVGVLTEQNKEKESIRKFLYAEFSMSASYDGIMSCLRDTSSFGDMNYYDRENDKWYDQVIKNNFKKISKGKFVNPKNYYFISNKDSVMSPDLDGTLYMKFGIKRVIKVTFNACISNSLHYNVGFGIASNNKNGSLIGEAVSGALGKKQYDGSYTFTKDVSEKVYNDFIKIEKWWGIEYISLNYLILEFDKSYTFFNFKEYIKNYSN